MTDSHETRAREKAHELLEPWAMFKPCLGELHIAMCITLTEMGVWGLRENGPVVAASRASLESIFNQAVDNATKAERDRLFICGTCGTKDKAQRVQCGNCMCQEQECIRMQTKDKLVRQVRKINLPFVKRIAKALEDGE